MENQITSPPEYNDEEKQYFNYLIGRLTSSFNQSNQAYPEIDDNTRQEWYEENAKAAHSYLRPKVNDQDKRIVTGTTQEREISLLSSLLNYNFEPNIEAFDDKDMMIAGLGKAMSTLVKKSYELEDYYLKEPLYFKELLDQGTVNIEDRYVVEYGVKKEIDISLADKIEIKNFKIKEKQEKVFDGFKTMLISGTSVFYGNFRCFYMKDQPYIFIRKEIPYEQAQMIFGNWERWKNVSTKVVTLLGNAQENIYRNWTLIETQNDMCELFIYYDKPKNETMIILNGAMMLPIKFPLTAVSPSGEYPVAKGDLEPISEWFVLSKSLPAKTKVHQQVLDEFYRLMILKTQQSFQPPVVNNTNRQLGRDIFNPGKIISGINPDKLKLLMDNNGVTPAEFSIFDMVKRMVDEQSTSPSFSGMKMTEAATATEINALQKQQMMKMGISVLGVINLKKQLTWLRIYNILKYWTQSIGSEIVEGVGEVLKYRSLSVEDIAEDGSKVLDIIEFNPNKVNKLSPEQITAESDLLTKKYGKKTRKTYLNPLELSKAKLFWKIGIVPSVKDEDKVKAELLKKSVADIKTLFGQQSVNDEYAKKRIVTLMGEDPDKFLTGFSMNPMMNSMMNPQGDKQLMVGQNGVAGQRPGQVESNKQISTLNNQIMPSMVTQ